MELFFAIQDKLSFLWEIGIPFLAALTILVFIHELGHYMMARWCGVRVEIFSVGFGKELKGWTDKNGTRWKIAMIPLGGYVKMFGEVEPAEAKHTEEETWKPLTSEEREVSFYHKPLLQRTAIVFAGPLINFLFAIFAYSILFSTFGVPTPINDTPLPVVGNVSAGSAAADAGLKRGDRIIRIDNENISFFSDLQRIVRVSPNRPLKFEIIRANAPLIKVITPGTRSRSNSTGENEKVGFLGISADVGELKYERQNPLIAIWMGVERTYFLTARLLEFVGEIFVGRQSTDELGGILRIAQISGQVAEMGIEYYLSFLAVLSVNLGLINLFPIPLLDGGHLAFYLIEAIRGRPLGPTAQEYGLRFGLVIVIALFVFVTWNDLVHLKFFEFITNVLG